MKKWLIILLCLLLAFMLGCQQNAGDTDETTNTTLPSDTMPVTQPATTVHPTTEPVETEPPVPETVCATVLADHTAVLMTTVMRGDLLEVVGEYDAYYYTVKLGQDYGLIAKKLVRLEGAEAYKQWKGYARSNAGLYDNYHLISGNEQKQKVNTSVLVLEDLGESLLVQVGDALGYMRASDVGKNKIQTSSGNSGGNDGGDISLSYQGSIVFLSIVVLQEGEVSGTATVLADNAEIIYGWFDRDEKLEIIIEPGFIDEKEGWYGIFMDGLYGYVRQNLALQEGEAPFEQWQGYAKKNAPLYDNYYLSGEKIKQLSTNTKVQVITDLEFCYLVQIGEDFGYMAKDRISKTKINTSSGNTGGDWTPPAM